MKRLLIIRFSAMGDVAMTVPVVDALAHSHPELKITVLTQERMVPLFSWMPENVCVKGINLKEYSGIGGLRKLYEQLKADRYDAVADIHDVLRTKYLQMRFRMNGTKVAVIQKGRQDRKALLGHGMEHEPLRPMVEKYAKVFQQLGLDITTTYTPPAIAKEEMPLKEVKFPAIGVAPFAAHQGKIYPLPMMKQVVDTLADQGNHIYLFGAGVGEIALLESWEREGVTSVAGKLGGLKNELILMSQLAMMISMDSSNMHMAALMGTRTISIWGATHPKAGFTAWNQPADSLVQKPLACRPCSIYGNKPCTKGNYPCMQQIRPETIVELAKKYGAQ